MTTGQLIKKARKEAGLTQAGLASRLGISYVGVSQWENGIRKPKPETLHRIASSIGVDFLDLLGEEEREMYTKGFEDGEIGAMFVKTLIATSPHSRDWYSYSGVEILLVKAFSALNDDGQKKAIERVEELTEIPKYQRARPAQDGKNAAPPSDTPETPPEDK